MVEPSNAIVSKMLDRLFAAMVNGPAMNCRPHASRQRIDLFQLTRLQDTDPGTALLTLMGPDHAAKIAARVPVPSKLTVAKSNSGEEEGAPISPEERAARQAWSEQQSFLTKLRIIADDARTYEQDTGVHALNVGFPLLSLPPGTFGGRTGLSTRRVLAPIAFIPAALTVKQGTRPSVELLCHGDGVDLVIPNIALLAWIEQQTGEPVINPFEDDAGEDPWREIAELVRLVAQRVNVPVPELFATNDRPAAFAMRSTPKADEDQDGPSIITSAILGLFPTSNQGLLKDTREIYAAGAPDGPIESFIRLDVSVDPTVPAIVSKSNGDAVALASAAAPTPKNPAAKFVRSFADERLVTMADPCQTQAVRLARRCRGLVIHGPPGTGKSQTIANVIGDHLARGERVLFVCDKRTALDVVADRLRSLGLGDLCATVHDPQRDQRELYRSVREQLDLLADTALKPTASAAVAKIDAELQLLHDELAKYHRDLMGPEGGGAGSFHHLVGQWLLETGDVGQVIDWQALQRVSPQDFERHRQRLKEVLERGDSVGFAQNPWNLATAVGLADFLAMPMDVHRRALADCVAAAEAADATVDPYLPPFDAKGDLKAEAQNRSELSEKLAQAAAIDADACAYWSKQSAAAVEHARNTLTLALADVEPRLRTGTPDASLMEVHATAPTAADQAVLVAYADDFDAKARIVARVRAADSDAAAADESILMKWLAADSKALVSARKRLDAAVPIAAAVEASTLDASLFARHEAAPTDAGKAFESLAALNAYLDVADKWAGALQFGKKKAAEPIVRHFGLSLSSTSAAQVRQFLTDLQKRSDLQTAVESATGIRFEDRPDDGELLEAFRHHRAVLVALTTTTQGVASAPSSATLSDASINALNALVRERAGAAKPVLDAFRLPLNSQSARCLLKHLDCLKVRSTFCEILRKFSGSAPSFALDASTPDQRLLELAGHLKLLLNLRATAVPGSSLAEGVVNALADRASLQSIATALQNSPKRAAAIGALERRVVETGLFSKSFMDAINASLRSGRKVLQQFTLLAEQLDTLEGVIRVREGLAQLPAELTRAAASLLDAGCGSAIGYSAVRRNVIAGEIARRLRTCPELQQVDGRRLKIAFDRFRHLSETKKDLVRDLTQDHWVSRQKQRLLAGTGMRLNKVGADLRRRLTLRGERAMRLRQVIAHGRGVDGGDPLFDLRPIWMASPETVAQLFPREPIFDVVVFDEASQCRLEEALPVLTRAHRVVIAGDPKQLPPTRFFETAVTTSDELVTESDQELFESHQGEVEDLLTAALGLDVHQCYLDVHYRSRNADLIGFSNEHFYGSRLQAIPQHPSGRSRLAPLRLYRIDGVYEKRRNVAEAEAVCGIVRDLLQRAAVPSIGIACFNMVQRDLIVEKLEELADADSAFAKALAEARERRGPNSSEGLFVKNLENVQGDERDHIIISTTYGPDPNGKFRRSFGPLGSGGGGRRLNVLVTRARDELHIVTSIPRSAYGGLPDVPPGTKPSGAWLLFAYLAYAEQLQSDYETNARILEAAGPAERAAVNPRQSRTPSSFARALASRIAARHNQGSDVHWGNDGFCVDLAMHHPDRAEDVTIGVLCDMSRFGGSEDPVEWDVFQSAVHERQGWTLHRIWTPHFFRDPDGAINEILAAINLNLASRPKEARVLMEKEA